MSTDKTTQTPEQKALALLEKRTCKLSYLDSLVYLNANRELIYSAISQETVDLIISTWQKECKRADTLIEIIKETTQAFEDYNAGYMDYEEFEQYM